LRSFLDRLALLFWGFIRVSGLLFWLSLAFVL
jgi:hypothetical protein